MARMAGNPNPRVTLAQLVEEGLGRQAAWATEEFRDVVEFHNWLASRHPGIGRQTSQAAWRYVRFAREAAEQHLNRGDRPPLRVIPIDPTIPANRGFRYELEVKFVDPDSARRGTNRDRSSTVYWIYHTNDLQTVEQLQRTAPRGIIQRLSRIDNRRRDRSPLPQGFEEFKVEITVRTVLRRGG